MKYLIGLDIGTSSVKGVLMTADGRLAATARGSFDYVRTDDGRVELDPNRYLDVCLETVSELADAADGGNIAGLCASSASGNLIVLDEAGRPMTPIIGWQDRRVTEESVEVLGEIDRVAFHRRIGWPFGGKAMPLSQLCYMKKHSPELIEDCSMAAMSTEYLYHALTGRWGISPSAGITYYLIDRNTGTYIGEILERLGLKESQLPPVMPCGSVLGGVTGGIAQRCHLPVGTPVVLGSFDHPSAARGTGVLEEGEMLLSCGTSWVVFAPVRDAEKGFAAGALVDPFLSPGGCYGVMSSVSSLSDRIKDYMRYYIDGEGRDFDRLTELAKRSAPGAGGLMAHLNDPPESLEAGGHPIEDVALAIMEGAVRLLKYKLDSLSACGITAKKAVMVGGPSENPFWAQLIERICGIEVQTQPGGTFAGAAGAAVIAGVGLGIYADEFDARRKLRTQKD